MSHPAHIILNSTIEKPDGLTIAISVTVPANADNAAIAERIERLKEVREQIEGAMDN